VHTVRAVSCGPLHVTADTVAGLLHDFAAETKHTAPGFGTQLAIVEPMDNYYEDRALVQRGPSPGIAAVLSVLIPGLGQVYNGNLLGGAIWFLAAGFGYWAILVPGFLLHALCVWFAYRDARDWHGY